jgi:signal transduction histidine kinase
VVFRDITERAKAEAALQASHDQFAVILQGIADGIVAETSGGQLAYANLGIGLYVVKEIMMLHGGSAYQSLGGRLMSPVCRDRGVAGSAAVRRVARDKTN